MDRYNQVFDLPYTIIRPSALYGERCISRSVGQIFIESPDTFDSVLLLIKNKFDGLEKEKDQTQKIFFEEILSSKNDISSQLETALNPLDILDYYLEIGSISYESKKFSKSQLFNVLEKLENETYFKFP